MIVIITNTSDQTTSDVIAWLHHFKCKFVRINVEDFIDLPTTMHFSSRDVKGYKSRLKSVNNHVIDNTSGDNMGIWFRRWARPSKLITTCGTESLEYQLCQFLADQIEEYQRNFFTSFVEAKWLNSLENINITKLDVLNRALSNGLIIPETIITTQKYELIAFANQFDKIVTKTIADTDFFFHNSSTWGLYTSIVSPKDLIDISDTFPPTLFQECVEKSYEIRSFLLGKEIFSMAIFSQNNAKTAVDFREYDQETPNRNVPYLLPKLIESKLLQLASDLQLNSCSFDLVKSVKGEYIFLEVNPVGQFGMVSYPCNYYLEEKVAHFINKLQEQ